LVTELPERLRLGPGSLGPAARQVYRRLSGLTKTSQTPRVRSSMTKPQSL